MPQNFPLPSSGRDTLQCVSTFSEQEEKILKFWEQDKTFDSSIKSRSAQNEYIFYDGPPFATGLPHYGHLLASTIKDVIPRYWTMQGYRVERRFGWDCHGLPIENIVEKELGSKSKKDIEEKIGIEKFNEACRSKVGLYVKEWEKIVQRMGRWVDFGNDYKTMDLSFMESIMWAFSELHKKDLIYEGRRISLYCSRCATPLSNFEIAMDNSYQMRHDQTATVKFRVPDFTLRNTKPELPVSILAWTTTPWTLPSNFALAVHPKLDYVMVEIEGTGLVLAKNLVEKFFGKDAKILENFKGADLVGLSYEPLFPYFEEKRKDGLFKIVGAEFVSDADGTGIVHLAPFGEDDFNFARENNLPIEELETVDEGGIFEEVVSDFVGMSVIDQTANKQINLFLEEKGLLFESKQHSHSYPHCYRCDTPLIYKPQRAYFLAVHKIKQNMLKHNQEVNWEPSHLKDGRFGKGLETAPDWNLSRNRFWGSPIPIWKCDGCGEEEVIGSVEELEKFSGKKVEDLHKHFVDKLTWKCKKCAKNMQRTPEVLDCWFESGAMPYAQAHFPFENNKKFEKTFPGDFIAEYIAQTRGWFYTLHVLSTALFDKPAFKNAICTGTILAEDGEKMSKSKQNYPDPTLLFDKYGADAMRFYLMGSSVMKGENFNFMESGVEEVIKTVLLPLQNTYKFFATYANIDNWQPTKFVFVRHGEGEHNIDRIYSGKVENTHSLTKRGQKQIRAVADKLPKFDVLISSPFVRTKKTAEILKKVSGFDGNVILDDRVRELDFGNLEGKKYLPPGERLKNSSTESVATTQKRLGDFISDMSKKYPGKTICVTSHGGVIRIASAIGSSVLSSDLSNEEYLLTPEPEIGDFKVAFVPPQPKNELDKWILSELQTTIKMFRAGFDGYDVARALQVVAPFVDNLNNWYLRRSRRRFWEGEPGAVSEDKRSAYETLHFVLLSMSKILAPICPFFAENLFKDLGGGRSVHLEMFPKAREDWVDLEAERRVALTREIVGLAAAIRARGKVKLRQPLGKLRFAVSNSFGERSATPLQKSPASETLKMLTSVVAKEANVAEVEVIEKLDGIATRIVKVAAKKVGKKFGSKVQELIREGKAGKFDSLDGGRIKIAGEVLDAGEYEFGFVCEEGVEAESTDRVVVLLDMEITEDLKIAGLAREIVRAIQERRKESGFEVSDRIVVRYRTESEDLKKTLKKFGNVIAEEVLAVEILEGDGGEKVVVDGEVVEVQLTICNNQ